MAHELMPHPAFPPSGVRRVAVRWHETRHGQIFLRWLVEEADALKVPPFAGSGRADKLWETTCFELFLADADGKGYREYNFAPSGRWAAYGFSGYRDGKSPIDPLVQPAITTDAGQRIFVLTAVIQASDIAGAARASLSAVIDEVDGTRSYWALAHPPGDPDFHDPRCFAMPLAAVQPA